VAKITNQVSLTLEIETFNELERIANDQGLRPGGAARLLIGERLDFLRLGWRLDDKRMADLLRMVCSLDEDERFNLEGYLRKRGRKK
jgi:hypothetical protein